MTIEAPDVGGSIVNPKHMIQNFAYLDVKNVVVHGLRVYDKQEEVFKYCAVLTLFLNENREDPIMLNVKLHEIFYDTSKLAQQIVIWANMTFGNVSRKVSIFDKETEEVVEQFNVTEMIDIQEATLELDEIKRTDTRKIH
jgi:hypothetical protein